MKRLFYILTSLLVLSSCTDELSVSNEYLNIREGDDVKVQFTINAPEEGIAETRTLGDMTDEKQKALNLWVLVFDNNGLFLQAAKATPSDNSQHGPETTGHTDTDFSVILNATSNQRRIHFVAFDGNADAGGLVTQISNTMNNPGSEAEKIAQELYATAGQAVYWQRIVVNGINKVDPEQFVDGTPKGIFDGYNTCIPLVRNFAKVSVDVARNEAGTSTVNNFTLDGFTIINVPDRGTIAPYNGGFVEYVDGKVQKTYEAITALGYEGSTPSGTTYTTIGAGDINANPHFLYETPNASGDAKGRTALIVKGSYKGTSGFYKVDLIYNKGDDGASNIFYNILRNFEYKVTINEVTGYGHTNFDEAVASAASNNLSSSTVTANLSRISDGEQMLEVTNTYFMFTESGTQTVLKYRYSYFDKNGVQHYNNNLIRLKTSDTSLFSSAPVIANTDDTTGEYAGWRTITMPLNSPADQAKTSNLHIYASRDLISAEDLHLEGDTNDELKNSILSGELLYRDVRVDLRNQYTLLVVPQSYVAPEVGAKVRVDLLIPQAVNEALFPMDFYLEDSEKILNPETVNGVPRLPVHVGPTLVGNSTNPESSFQYARTVTKAEYASLSTQTVNGVTYKVIPCYFKTTVAASAGTTIYASNEYFNKGNGQFKNTPAAFRDNSSVTIASDYKQYYGKGYPVTLTFYATKEAGDNDDDDENRAFTIKVTEGDTPELAAKFVKKTLINDGTDLNGAPKLYYKYEYTYNTQTINGASISATVSNNYDSETKTASLTMERRYFVIKALSFTTNVTDFLDELDDGTKPEGDGSEIYIKDGYNETSSFGTYVGWFGRGLPDAEDGYLTDNGPKQDYVIDRYYQGYTTLTGTMPVTFRVYNENKTITATTTIDDLDFARTNTDESLKPKINFVEIPSSSSGGGN